VYLKCYVIVNVNVNFGSLSCDDGSGVEFNFEGLVY
jgi:hypothetical protein